jgi:hypothetical protein
MRTAHCFLRAAGAAFLALAAASAQTFNSGSTGAYGPLNVTSNRTLDLPPDGVFHCTTISIAPGATLDFNPNALNTPVYLLASGDVSIAGAINVSGKPGSSNLPGQGGPGGFSGGYGGYGVGLTARGGDGLGPGAGRNLSFQSQGVHVLPGLSNSNVYGNALCSPLVGGSGGAGGDGNPGPYGGGGGGALLVASSSQILIDGALLADGGVPWGPGGYGSGGAVRLVAPLVTGRGGVRTSSGYFGPASGRVRVDCLDRYAFRSLSLSGATVTRGAQMFVFPAVVPRLDIVAAAGQAIAEGAANSVQVDLPVGSPTNQTVVVQARDFSGLLPIAVVVTPEVGPSTTYPAQIDMGSGNPARATVNVVIPIGTISRIHAWTR